VLFLLIAVLVILPLISGLSSNDLGSSNQNGGTSILEPVPALSLETIPASLNLLAGGARWAAQNGSSALFIDWEDNYLAHGNSDGINWGPWPQEADMENWTLSVAYVLSQAGFDVHFAGDFPDNLTGYNLLVIQAYWAVEPRYLAMVRDFIANGGGVVILSGVPEYFRCYCKDWWTYCCPTDNASLGMDQYFGCDGNYVNTGGYAYVTVNHPFGTALLNGDPVIDAPGQSNAGINNPYEGSQVIAEWEQGYAFAYTFEYGQGRVYYQAGYNCLGTTSSPPPSGTSTLRVFAYYSVEQPDGSYQESLVPASVTVSGPQSQSGTTTTDPNNPLSFTLTPGTYSISGTYDDTVQLAITTISQGQTSDVSLYFGSSGSSSPPPSNGTVQVSIAPSAVTAAPNQLFNVNVAIANVTDLYAWQIKLYYQSTVLNCTDVVEGPFLKSGGSTVWVIDNDPSYNSTRGMILFGASLIGQIPGVNGNGTLATISFQTMALGNATLDIADSMLLDSNLQDISHSAFGSIVEVQDAVFSSNSPAMRVVLLIASFFGKSVPPAPETLDLNKDGRIDMRDIAMAAKNPESFIDLL
jgi:hypothetical protein